MKHIKSTLYFLILSAVILTVGLTTILSDKVNNLERLERKQLELTEEYKIKRSHAENLEAYQQQLTELERSFSELLRALPDSVKQPEVHLDVSQLALVSGMEVKKFNLERQEKKGFYEEYIFNVQFDSDFEYIFSFVEGLYSLPRLGSINSLKIRPYGSKLRADFEILFYRYLSEDEI